MLWETVKSWLTWERATIIVLAVLLLISLFYPRYQFIATGNGYVFRGDRATGKVFVFRAQHLYAEQRRLEAARVDIFDQVAPPPNAEAPH